LPPNVVVLIHSAITCRGRSITALKLLSRLLVIVWLVNINFVAINTSGQRLYLRRFCMVVLMEGGKAALLPLS
jgi:hypothetical protein